MSVPNISIGVAMISLWSKEWLFDAEIAEYAFWWAIENGFEYFQTMPHRWLNSKKWYCDKRYSRYKENAWNPVDNVLQAVLHQDGADMKPAGVQDFVLFPDEFTCNQVFSKLPGREITHDFGPIIPDNLVEINPGIGMNPEKIVQAAIRRNCKFVLDTQHLFDPRDQNDLFAFGQTKWPLGKSYQAILDAVTLFAPLVGVFHVKGTKDHHKEVIEKYLSCSDRLPKIDVVAEYKPNPLATCDEAIARAKSFFQETKKLFRAP